MKSEAIVAWIYKILLSTLAFIAPVNGLMLSIGFLLFIDLILGIMTARKNGIPIQSKELKKTVIKMLLYQVTVISAFILDTYFIQMGSIVVRITALSVGITEAKSIFEHVGTLTGLDIWSVLKDKLKSSVSSSTKDAIRSSETPKDPPANS